MSVGYTYVLTALLIDCDREQSWILHAKTWSVWHALGICCRLACYLRSVPLCQEQCVQERSGLNQELSVLQWADCMLGQPTLLPQHWSPVEQRTWVLQAFGLLSAALCQCWAADYVWACSWVFTGLQTVILMNYASSLHWFLGRGWRGHNDLKKTNNFFSDYY